MDIIKCEALIIAADSGSLSAAALELGYSPSGVIRMVNALEDEIGFPLLIRDKKGVSLTADGKRMLPALRELVRCNENILQISAEVCGLTIGSLTIGTYSSIATHWLPPVIKDFQEKYPQIEIRLMDGVHQEIDGWISEKRTDIAFYSYKEPMPYDWLPLAEDPMIAVLPKTHPFANAPVYPLMNCQTERFIMPALGRDDDVAELFRRNNLTPKICYSTMENFAALAMIEQGMGMSIMNELITKKQPYDVVKLPLDPPQQITLGIAIPSLKSASPAAKRFVDFAEKRLSCLETPK